MVVMKKWILVVLIIFPFCGMGGAWGQNTICLNALEFSEKINSIEGAVIIDVRTASEYSEGHIPHAKNIDWLGNDFDMQISKLDTLQPIFIYCLSGRRSASAADRMFKKGFKQVYELDGGIIKWREAKLPEATIN
jgi:thioredoxin 1